MPVSGGMPMPAAGVAAPVGGAPLAPQDNNNVFGPSNGVLAQLEMNGTLDDSSGSNRPGAGGPRSRTLCGHELWTGADGE